MNPESIQKALDNLTVEERAAYDVYLASGRPSLSLEVSLKLYELFLHGESCQQIAKLNPGFNLGMIVRARVEHLWDDRKDAYVAQLYSDAGATLRQTAMESVRFLHLALAATHKRHGEAFAKFLQTGDPDDLPPNFKIDKVFDYLRLVESLMKITGQDQKKEVKHSGSVETIPMAPPMVGQGPLTPALAGRLLDAVDKESKDN